MSINIPSIINLFNVDSSHFVQDAYAIILGRDPDSSGNSTYEKKLGRGSSRRRRKIILALAKSPEARARNPLLPMLAREAVRLERWRLLPWNRSAIAIAMGQVANQESIEFHLQSLESKISAVEDNIHLIENSRSLEHTPRSDESIIPLIEHTMRSLKGISFTLSKIEYNLISSSDENRRDLSTTSAR